MAEWLTVEEVAVRLGVSRSHVRRLAQNGKLPARRLSGIWLIDGRDVATRTRSTPAAGRPMSPERAWQIIGLLVHELEPSRPAPQLADRRVRHRLRRLLDTAPPPETWDQWLRNRATPQRLHVHPGVLDALTTDGRLWLSGGRAAACAGIDLADGPDRCFYVDAADVESVIADFRARPSADGQVVLRVVPPDMAAVTEVLQPRGAPVPAVVAALDLLGSADARPRFLAAETLRRARAGAQSP